MKRAAERRGIFDLFNFSKLFGGRGKFYFDYTKKSIDDFSPVLVDTYRNISI